MDTQQGDLKMSVVNKVIFISGAGSGIGRATTKVLTEAGARVFSIDISADNLEALKAEVKAGSFDYVAGSVSDEEAVKGAFEQCEKVFGPVDILLNNAGLGLPTPDIAETDLATYQKMVDVNMTGVFLCSREALKHMKQQGKGHILALISMAGQRTNPGAPIYCASKFGARGLNSGLGDQILKLGIKVTDVNPGPVNSNYWGDRDVPREKFLSVEDVASVIKFAMETPEHMVIREINFDSIAWLAK
jgi:NADP-dependent 3-hydroxy acid dehydrogenase YdfG